MTEVRVLFVCLGNICRSPMADAIFQDMVKKAGLSDMIVVDSAGMGSWHVGERAHPGTLRILSKHHIDYKGRARQFSRVDLDNFDYVLAMDKSNLRDIMRFMNERETAQASMFYRDGRKLEVGLFLSYAQTAGTVSVEEVPDPYYNDRFEQVYDLVQKGSEALLQHIRTTHNL